MTRKQELTFIEESRRQGNIADTISSLVEAKERLIAVQMNPVKRGRLIARINRLIDALA